MGYQRPTLSFGPPLSPAVKMLIIWNFIFFLLQQTLGRWLVPSELSLDWFSAHFGLRPVDVVTRGYVWQLVTYMFLHGGILHIGLNMFALWMFGGELEYLWGSRRWLRYYFITGIGGGVTTIIFAYVAEIFGIRAGYPYIATIGASGSVFGLLLAFGLTFPNRILLVGFFFPMKAKFLVLIFGAIAFFNSVSYANDGVGHFAHLGGMIFGYILLRGWPGQGMFRRWKQQRMRRKFRVIESDDDEPWRRRWP